MGFGNEITRMGMCVCVCIRDGGAGTPRKTISVHPKKKRAGARSMGSQEVTTRERAGAQAGEGCSTVDPCQLFLKVLLAHTIPEPRSSGVLAGWSSEREVIVVTF